MAKTNSKTVLITGGRAPVGLGIGRAFKNAGWRVLSAESSQVDLLGTSNSCDKCFLVSSPRFKTQKYLSEIKQIIDQEKVELIIPTCEEIFYLSILKQDKKYRKLLLSPSQLDLLSLHNKWEFIKKSQNYGLSVPLTKTVIEANQFDDFAKQKSWVLKPVWSRFGVQACTPMEKSIYQSKYAPWIAQKYIKGNEVSTYSIANKGKVLSTVIYSSKYRWKNKALIYFEKQKDARVEKWIQKFVLRENYTGQISFDFILTQDKIYCIECNPRTVSGLFLLSDSQIVEALANRKLIITTDSPPQMLLLPMLLSLRLGNFKQIFIDILRAKPILLLLYDFQPFIKSLLGISYYYKIAKQNNLDLTAATTFDIEYNQYD